MNLHTYDLPKFRHNEIRNLNTYIINSKIETN